MSYTLYYSPGACSMAVHVLLNELKAPFTAQRCSIAEGQTRTPEFLKLNPRGQIPVLQENNNTLCEGAAIITYLCDTHPSPLLPAKGWERAQALQWLMFANASLHGGYSKAAFIKKNSGPADLFAKACDDIQAMWDQIENTLTSSGQPFLCGAQPTAGDIVVTVIANWDFLGRAFTFGPKTKALLRAVSSRPAYQQAITAEQIQYKAAA